MQRLQGISGPAVLVALVLFVPTAASAQLPASKPAKFDTADGVEIKGRFYPSAKGKEGPAVMLLHAMGESCQKAEYVSLAKALQKAGYGVLTFDFRSHGDSTNVKPGDPTAKDPLTRYKGFWDYEANRLGVSGYSPKPRPTEIEYNKFSSTYHRVLVNDIAAAKAYLDQRNDAGECDSGSLILIGAKEGATLGAIWMNSEWHRYKLLPGGALDTDTPPEGQNVVCAIWLSISPTLANPKKGGQTVNVPATLDVPGRQRKVPIAFFYGQGDSQGEKVALLSEKLLKGTNKKDYQFTGALKLAGAKGAVGSGLLSKSLDTEKEIVTYLGNALEAKDWKLRVTKDSYVWRVSINGRLQTVLARAPGRENVQFATYAYFVRQ